MDSEKSQKLKAFLDKLPDHVLERLTQAVELDKLADASELPHELLLEGLRPSIATSEHHVNRTPTPMRMFCVPFEDLLVAGRRGKHRGRIARASLSPVWEWLASELMPTSFREHYDKLTTAILDNDQDDIRACSIKFHQAGAKALTKALEGATEGSKRRIKLASELGGEDIVDDAEDMAKVLEAVPEIFELRDNLVEPVPTLSRDQLRFVCDQYEAIEAKVPGAGPYALAVAMHRLTRPWEIMRAAAFIKAHADADGVSRSDLDMAVDILFADMEDCIAYFEEQKARSFDPDAAHHHIMAYARIAQGIAKELDVVGNERWRERYDELQARGAGEFERLIEQVPGQIKVAMPFRMAGGYASTTSRRPDLRRDPEPELLERAIKLATFMRESRPLAYAANISSTHSDAYDVILDNLNSYRNGLLSELRSFEDASMLSRARAYLDLTVELTAILVSEGEAQIYRRQTAQAERPDRAANG